MARVADLRTLKHQGIVFKVLLVPRAILSSVFCIVDLAGTNPGRHNWIIPGLL